MSVQLRVDRLVVDTHAEREAAERVPAALREALKKLGEKLAARPSDAAAMRQLSLERLEIEVGSVEEILGERGAERLAERLFVDLTRRTR